MSNNQKTTSASGMYFSTKSGGWMSNSAVASLPAKVKIANSLPGCWEKKLDTLRTRPCKTTQTSPFLVCLATSSIV